MKIILISHERSGSHLVAEAMHAFGLIQRVDEVCNIGAVSPLNSALSFHRFQYDWAQENRDEFLMQKFEDRRKFVDAYFNFLADKFPKADVLVDIKYGHFHNFDPFWHPVFSTPMLFEVLKAPGFKTIHLSRRNVVEAAVSGEVADVRGVWHSWQEGAAAKQEQTHQLDVGRVVKRAKLLKMQNRWISEEWLSGVDAKSVQYESFVDSLNGDRKELDDLATFLSKTADPEWLPTLKKLGKPLRETVENYDELARACDAAGLGEFLR